MASTKLRSPFMRAPPGAQKSFCTSMTTRAVCSVRTVSPSSVHTSCTWGSHISSSGSNS